MVEGDAFFLGVLVTAAGLWIAHATGMVFPDRNQVPTFSDKSGLPVNCRALIQSNLEGYHRGDFNADAALGAIERNCGPHGIIWDK